MTVQIGPYEFSPTLLPSIAAVMLIALFISLGTWQLGRADQKRGMLLEYDKRSNAPAASLQLPLDNVENWRYRKVRLQGRYDAKRQFLLDNQVYKGKAGYQVLTPFKLNNSNISVLVDRGWVTQQATRSQRPTVEIAAANDITLTGTVYAPFGESYSLGGMDEDETRWPRLIQFTDFELLSQRAGYPLANFIIRLDPSEPNGFTREWRIVGLPPEKHLAYAVQWYALALAVLLVYAVVNTRRTDKELSA